MTEAIRACTGGVVTRKAHVLTFSLPRQWRIFNPDLCVDLYNATDNDVSVAKYWFSQMRQSRHAKEIAMLAMKGFVNRHKILDVLRRSSFRALQRLSAERMCKVYKHYVKNKILSSWTKIPLLRMFRCHIAGALTANDRKQL